MPDARQHAEVPRAEHDPGLEHEVARLEVLAGAAHRVADRDLAIDENVGTVDAAPFDHGDRVGAGGHRGPGHDADGLAGGHRRVGRITGRDRAGDPQPSRRIRRRAGQVGGTNGEPVDSGVRERRDLARRRHGRRGDQAPGMAHRHRDRVEDRAAVEHVGLGIVQRNHACQRR